ncbi:hypothetical protein ABZ297_30830, partial [Nonomuraea sp. NPDC005983]|uniref:hypothetical protein n=1 Tax=Nonomuraea sp. NPDC005983 TaxID=3155595 RepID=UPI0033BD6396
HPVPQSRPRPRCELLRKQHRNPPHSCGGARQIKAGKKRGSFVEGVYVRTFTGQNVDREIVFVNMAYASNEGGTLPVSVRDIRLEKCRIDGADAVLNLVGLESDHLVGVHLEKCLFTGVTGPDKIAFTDDLTMRHVLVNGVER